MIVSLFTFLLVGLGQLSDSPAEAVPYEFQMKDGTTLYGLARPSDVTRGSFSILIEEPWRRNVETKSMRGIDVESAYQEAAATRSQRIKREWTENGGILVGEGSEQKWVLKTELALAKRAQELVRPPSQESTVQGVVVPETQVQTTVEPVGFVTQWWVHGAIGILGLVLAGGALWFGFLRRDWQGVSL